MKYRINGVHLKTLLLLASITLTHCCAKQAPPNFGVPVYKPSSATDEENRTIKKQFREERSVGGRYRHRSEYYLDTMNEDSSTVFDTSNTGGEEESEERSESSILNVIRTIISDQKTKQVSPNQILEPSHRTIQNSLNNGQENGIQTQNLNFRVIRSAAVNTVAKSTRNAHELIEQTEEEGGNQEKDSTGSGWNTAAAITGFALAAIMLLGVTCFIRNSCRSRRKSKDEGTIVLLTDKDTTIYTSL